MMSHSNHLFFMFHINIRRAFIIIMNRKQKRLMAKMTIN